MTSRIKKEKQSSCQILFRDSNHFKTRTVGAKIYKYFLANYSKGFISNFLAAPALPTRLHAYDDKNCLQVGIRRNGLYRRG